MPNLIFPRGVFRWKLDDRTRSGYWINLYVTRSNITVMIDNSINIQRRIPYCPISKIGLPCSFSSRKRVAPCASSSDKKNQHEVYSRRGINNERIHRNDKHSKGTKGGGRRTTTKLQSDNRADKREQKGKGACYKERKREKRAFWCRGKMMSADGEDTLVLVSEYFHSEY